MEQHSCFTHKNTSIHPENVPAKIRLQVFCSRPGQDNKNTSWLIAPHGAGIFRLAATA
jgi:hypothetical protein